MRGTDTLPSDLLLLRRQEKEDERVDVLSIPTAASAGVATHHGTLAQSEPSAVEEDSFVLPVLYDITDSEAEDALVKLTATTYRKKDIHEGKEYEVDEGEVGGLGVGGAGEGGKGGSGEGSGKSRRRK